MIFVHEGKRFIVIDGKLNHEIGLSVEGSVAVLDIPSAPQEVVRTKQVKKIGKKSPTAEKRAGGYDHDEIVKLATRVASREISSQDAADELGTTIANWYRLKNMHAKHIKKGPVKNEHPKGVNAVQPEAAAEEEEDTHAKFSGNIGELRERVQELKAEGMTSAEVAKELGLTLTTIGKVWN